MKDAWGDLTGKFGGSPPPPLRDNPLYTEALVDVPTRIVTAMMMVNIGRTDIAGNSLQAIRRRTQQDAARERHRSARRLRARLQQRRWRSSLAYDETPPDWSRENMAAELSARAAAVEKLSQRCDAMAGHAARAAGISPADRRHARLAHVRAAGDRDARQRFAASR